MKGEDVRPCERCRRPTRPPRANVADFPGTTRRAGDLCKTCHEGGVAVVSFEPRPSIEEMRADLDAFLARRRDRENAMFRREFITAYPHLVKESA